MLTANGSFATSVWDETSKIPLTSIATTVAREMFVSAPPRAQPPPEAAEKRIGKRNDSGRVCRCKS